MEMDYFVETQEEFDELYHTMHEYGLSCIERTGKLLGHVDSMSVAHDFEAVRLALGGEPFNYIGLSYGTVIGTTYLEQFPDNIRSFVLDSNADHSQLQPYNGLIESRT